MEEDDDQEIGEVLANRAVRAIINLERIEDISKLGLKSRGRNIGEKDEPRVVKKILDYYDKNQVIEQIGEIKNITDVYGKVLAKSDKGSLEKASSIHKSDVMINEKGYSIKSFRGAPPSIINHTHRASFLKAMRVLDLDIGLLDTMINEYWDMVLHQKHGTEIISSEPDFPFFKTPERREYMKKILDYFMFSGTGTRLSKSPADYILEITDPDEISGWDVVGKDHAFESYSTRFIFSMVKKGLPRSYLKWIKSNKTKNTNKTEYFEKIHTWVREIDGNYYGSLHVRVKKSEDPKIFESQKPASRNLVEGEFDDLDVLDVVDKNIIGESTEYSPNVPEPRIETPTRAIILNILMNTKLRVSFDDLYLQISIIKKSYNQHSFEALNQKNQLKEILSELIREGVISSVFGNGEMMFKFNKGGKKSIPY